ncbi:hypothetical protein ACMT1E_09150 [Sphingomonas flavalba]|uniref:hypothetical protein n=1 Tax=Sphingomonas flavalba TaxID=2559804 RepID=UPI0039E09F87
MMRHAPFLLLLLAAAACQKQPEPANQAVPLEEATPLPDAMQEEPGRDGIATERGNIPEIAGLAVADGRWTLTDGPAARFGLGGEPVFSIACDKAMRMIVMTRAGVNGTALQLLTERGATRFDAQTAGDDTVARFAAGYPWFKDVLAKAGGAIGVRVEDGIPLVLPADPLIGEVVAGCR